MSTDQISTEGQFVTFYSYKGGVGRTMALANVAWAAALDGKKVVIIDFDLEAPGISSIIPFQDSMKQFHHDCNQSIKNGGLFELILYFQKHQLVPAIPEFFSCNAIKHEKFKGDGIISIIPAGKEDKKYREKLQSFNWNKFYLEQDGKEFIFRLRDTIMYQYDQPDLVLIDSRTGLTDIGSICTVLLPDTLVVLTGMNYQNLAGSQMIIESTKKHSEYRKKENYLKPIKIITVASHIPYDQEMDKTNERLKEGKNILGKDFDIILHYVPILSLEERLLVEYQENDIQNAGVLVKSYKNLYKIIISQPILPDSKNGKQMSFNQNTWKEKAVTRLKKSKDLIKKSGTPIYATVAGITLLPLVQTAMSSSGYFSALQVLLNLLSGVGSNQVAAELENLRNSNQTISEPDIIQWIEKTVSHHPQLRNELDEIMLKLDAIPNVQKYLSSEDKKWFITALEKQLREMGNYKRYEQIIIQGDKAHLK